MSRDLIHSTDTGLFRLFLPVWGFVVCVFEEMFYFIEIVEFVSMLLVIEFLLLSLNVGGIFGPVFTFVSDTGNVWLPLKLTSIVRSLWVGWGSLSFLLENHFPLSSGCGRSWLVVCIPSVLRLAFAIFSVFGLHTAFSSATHQIPLCLFLVRTVLTAVMAHPANQGWSPQPRFLNLIPFKRSHYCHVR